MSTPDDQSGLNTPPFSGSSPGADDSAATPSVRAQPTGDQRGSQPTGDHRGPQFLPDGRLAGYSAADFPAPAGVPVLGSTPAAPAPSSVATMTRARPRRLAGLLVAASMSAVIGAGAGIGSYAYVTADQVGGSATSPVRVTTVSAADSPVLDGTITAAAARIDASTVTISVESGQGGGVGTGVVLDTDGHILTNNHVVESAAQRGTITVAFDDGTTATAKVVGTSPSNDLAVIKVDGSADLSPATFASSASVEVGQAVVAVGAPLGLSETVTSGIVSNEARPVRSGSDNTAVYLAVQTDTAINPGNSGGPLVDLNGDVVGINSSIASTGSGAGGASPSGNIGIGFAIPADVAARVAAELISSGTSTNAAIGVTVGGSDSAQPTASGVELQSVVSGGAADQAGLQAGDRVSMVNDFATTTPDGLIAATRFYAPGTKVEVAYVRDGEERTAEVTLGSS